MSAVAHPGLSIPLHPWHDAAARTSDGTPPMNAPASDRAPDGKFAPGNKGGPGNPFARRVAALRTRLILSATDDDMDKVAALLKEKALSGDLAAIKLWLSYVAGRPIPTPSTATTCASAGRTRPLPRTCASSARACRPTWCAPRPPSCSPI